MMLLETFFINFAFFRKIKMNGWKYFTKHNGIKKYTHGGSTSPLGGWVGVSMKRKNKVSIFIKF